MNARNWTDLLGMIGQTSLGIRPLWGSRDGLGTQGMGGRRRRWRGKWRGAGADLVN
jgi:hypothetical protein